MKFFITLLLALITINLSAMTVKSINYKGMVHISKPVALRMLDFEVGDSIDEKNIDNAIKKYFKQGYFNDVWVDVENGNIVFHFKEKAIISKIELKGWKDGDKEIKASVIQIKKGSLYDKSKLEAAKKRIIEAISQEGVIDSVVEIDETYLENGSVQITFLVNEGEEIVIKKLKYSGVVGLDSDMFDDVIANKEHEFMGWFWGRNDGEMKVSDLAYDPLRIRDLYMQYGYLDAKIEVPFVRVSFDDYTAEMSYQVKEGAVYNISAITINQVKHVIDEEKIREIIKLTEGEAFNIKTFRDDAKKIKTIIADLSYAFVQVVPDLKKNVKEHTVEVVFKITPGEKVRIRNVKIAGNNRTLDRIIRRELYLGPNDMYSLTDLTDSRNALGRLGYFESNTIEEKRIDNTTMDLIVKVKEAPTGNIQIGGGYGSYGGLLLTLAVDDRNLWGSGINMGIKAERSQMTSNYSFSISNPRLNDSDFSGSFSVYKSMYKYNDYTVDSLGLNFGVGHRFTRHLSGYLGYSFSKNSYELDQYASLAATTNYYFESYAKSSIITSLTYDDTDDYYLPRKGYSISESVEKAGVGFDANFIKSRTTFNKYIGLADYLGFDAIFRYKARFNYVKDTGYLPIADRFYMGGIGSVRGYESYSLSPMVLDRAGTIYQNNRRIGGEYTGSNSIELSFPLVPKAKMRLVTYIDWGFIGSSGNALKGHDGAADIPYVDPNSASMFGLGTTKGNSVISRGGYGAGLEWFSPVGPIQLMFSQPLNAQTLDKISHFEFTMGQRF